jgi:hypothetical protein
MNDVSHKIKKNAIFPVFRDFTKVYMCHTSFIGSLIIRNKNSTFEILNNSFCILLPSLRIKVCFRVLAE